MSFLSENDDDPYNPRKNLTVGIILAMLAGGGSLIWRYWDDISGSGAAHRTAQLERELSTGLQMVNRMVPRQVDEVTTLTGARVEGHEFTYLYSLSQEIPAERLRPSRRTSSAWSGRASAAIRRCSGSCGWAPSSPPNIATRAVTGSRSRSGTAPSSFRGG
jgi:hypothetical protein